MKVLIINGSPRGERSTTMLITRAFTEGLAETVEAEVKTVTLTKKRIEPCQGCYCCWKVTPGKCVIKDDMTELLEDYIKAEVVIWSFPLYYHSLPSKAMAVMQRLLPLNLPQIEEYGDGLNDHPPRYDFSKKKYVMISTCGFASRERNFESLIKQFEIIYGDKLTPITVPEGGIFYEEMLMDRINEYLGYIKEAGSELAGHGEVSKETWKKINELIIPMDMYLSNVNKYLTGKA